MGDIVSVDSLLDGWYPGWTPELIEAPYMKAKAMPFSKEDESSFWFADLSGISSIEPRSHAIH